MDSSAPSVPFPEAGEDYDHNQDHGHGDGGGGDELMLKSPRVLREKGIEPSEEIKLPVGIMDQDGSRHKLLRIDEMCGKDDKNIAQAKTKRNPALATTLLLRRSIQEIDGLLNGKRDPMGMCDVKFVRERMTQIDRDYVLANIFVLSGKPTTWAKAKCEDDEIITKEKIHIRDLPVYDWPDDAPLQLSCILPRGHRDTEGLHKDLTMAFVTGDVQEKIVAAAAGNGGYASTLMWASQVRRLGTHNGIDQDIAERIKSLDRQYVGSLYQDYLPGLPLGRKMMCDGDCAEELDGTVDLSGFFIRAWEAGK